MCNINYIIQGDDSVCVGGQLVSVGGLALVLVLAGLALATGTACLVSEMKRYRLIRGLRELAQEFEMDTMM